MTEQEIQIERDLQRDVDAFVNREVYYCASTLVHELVKKPEYCDELLEVCSRRMYLHTFSYVCHAENENGEECGETWEEEENDPRTESWDRMSVDEMEDFTRKCPKCGEENAPDSVSNEDTDPEEAYEHWIVSNWLADKLEERGEMVLRDFLGLTIWGRICTGQAISMDYVMRDIWKSLQRS